MKEFETIEMLNANGPYDHGIWSEVEGATIGKDLLNIGKSNAIFYERSKYLVAEIVRALRLNFSNQELNGKSILDVGCYDGWILTQIQKTLSFESALGVEPRIKNIQKGKNARALYEIDSTVEYVVGDIETLEDILPNKKFDIVLCLGTLHHVESTPNAIASLAAKCKELLIIDSMVIEEPKKDRKRILELLNLRDIAYLQSQRTWGIAAFKYESPYFDGSTSKARIVNVPDTNLINMSLTMNGFKILETINPEEKSYQKDFQKLRGVKEAFVVGLKIENPEEESNLWWKIKARIHEELFLFNVLPAEILLKLDSNLDCIEMPLVVSDNQSIIKRVENSLLVWASKAPTKFFRNKIIQSGIVRPELREILFNISRSPMEKINLELAKYFLINRKYVVAKAYLLKITKSNNSDWRTFYRACYLLSLVGSIEIDNDFRDYYLKLLQISNIEFPLNIKAGLKWLNINS